MSANQVAYGVTFWSFLVSQTGHVLTTWQTTWLCYEQPHLLWLGVGPQGWDPSFQPKQGPQVLAVGAKVTLKKKLEVSLHVPLTRFIVCCGLSTPGIQFVHTGHSSIAMAHADGSTSFYSGFGWNAQVRQFTPPSLCDATSPPVWFSTYMHKRRNGQKTTKKVCWPCVGFNRERLVGHQSCPSRRDSIAVDLADCLLSRSFVLFFVQGRELNCDVPGQIELHLISIAVWRLCVETDFVSVQSIWKVLVILRALDVATDHFVREHWFEVFSLFCVNGSKIVTSLSGTFWWKVSGVPAAK